MLVHSIFCIFPAISGHFWLTDRSLWSDPNSEVSEYFFRCPPPPPSSQDARQPRCRASSNILSVRKSYLVTSTFCRSLSTAVFERTQWTRFVGINRHVATRIQRTCSLKSSSCLGENFHECGSFIKRDHFQMHEDDKHIDKLFILTLSTWSIFGDTAGGSATWTIFLASRMCCQKSLACPAHKPRHRSFQQQSSVPFDPRPPQCLPTLGVAEFFKICSHKKVPKDGTFEEQS